MKNYAFILILAASLISCSGNETELTVEERVLMQIYGSYQSALSYDEVCAGNPKFSHLDLNDQENVKRLANEQLIIDRLLEVRQVRLSTISADKLASELEVAANMIGKKAASNLEKQGCYTSGAKAAKRLYERYSSVSPVTLSKEINKQIIKHGGDITSPNNSGK